MSHVPPRKVPSRPSTSYWIGEGMPINTKPSVVSIRPCAYCGNDVQPLDAYRCWGCGAPLKGDGKIFSGLREAVQVFSGYIDYRENS